jgi:hypothetical protein
MTNETGPEPTRESASDDWRTEFLRLQAEWEEATLAVRKRKDDEHRARKQADAGKKQPGAEHAASPSINTTPPSR